VLRVLAAALLLGAAALPVTASPASASDPACNYDARFNACLRLDDIGYLWYSVHVGIDVHMPDWSAQEIVACGDSAFEATLYGDDGDGDWQHIRDLVLDPGWPASGEGGLGAELSLPYVHTTELDEDDDSEDEIFAVISFHDCHHIGQPYKVAYLTGTIHGYF
jgi:hypothetical protein